MCNTSGMTQTSTRTEVEQALIGRTTRPVLFSDGDDRRRMPTGTTVYVLATREQYVWLIRIPGTLYTQKVEFAAVEPS